MMQMILDSDRNFFFYQVYLNDEALDARIIKAATWQLAWAALKASPKQTDRRINDRDAALLPGAEPVRSPPPGFSAHQHQWLSSPWLWNAYIYPQLSERRTHSTTAQISRPWTAAHLADSDHQLEKFCT